MSRSRPVRGQVFALVTVLCATAAIGACRAAARTPDKEIDRIAVRYVQLAAALANRDPDSSSGDTASSAATTGDINPAPGLPDIAVQARMMADELRSVATAGDRTRVEWLSSQLRAVSTRASR